MIWLNSKCETIENKCYRSSNTVMNLPHSINVTDVMFCMNGTTCAPMSVLRYVVDGKTNDFEQRMWCGAPIHWLKYTTHRSLGYLCLKVSRLRWLDGGGGREIILLSCCAHQRQAHRQEKLTTTKVTKILNNLFSLVHYITTKIKQFLQKRPSLKFGPETKVIFAASYSLA